MQVAPFEQLEQMERLVDIAERQAAVQRGEVVGSTSIHGSGDSLGVSRDSGRLAMATTSVPSGDSAARAIMAHARALKEALDEP